MTDTRGALAICVGGLAAASFAACASRSRRVGGSGGRFAWSSVGGSLRGPWVSVEVVLVCVDARDSDKFEAVDICETSEALEPLRVLRVCVEGLRGGKAGDNCDESVRVGRGGGARRPLVVGDTSWAGSEEVVVRRGSAGTESRACGRAGSEGEGAPFPLVFPFEMKACDAGLARLVGGGGGGRFPVPSPVLLKFFWLLSAAIRSARELNWRSSTSAMSRAIEGVSAQSQEGRQRAHVAGC